MGRAVSVTQLMTKKRHLLPFEGAWLDSFGTPELGGSWLIHGDSGGGKTRLALQLCKYLTKFGRVAYNSMEEGDSESMRLAFAEVGMEEVKRRIVLLDNEPIAELRERLRKRKSADIVVIDSVQYSGMSYAEYKELRGEFRSKLLIIVSHAKGRLPDGKVAEKIRFDSFVKIYVAGYTAFVTSRYKTGTPVPFVIWKEEAEKCWGDKIKQ